MSSGFQDVYFGALKHGRACAAADFDLDGWTDFYIGNPSDESFVIRNETGSAGAPLFTMSEVLLNGQAAWGVAVSDYDNDGDYDIFINGGGNETGGWCWLFRNLYLETQTLTFQDVTLQAGVQGGVPDGEVDPALATYANANWFDFDLDGDTDIFVNVNFDNVDSAPPGTLLRNLLWRNNGDGTFTEVGQEVGLGDHSGRSRHSAILDVDNDGDFDIYENNWQGRNYLWSNQLKETGDAVFIDNTLEVSGPGDDIGNAIRSFASATADFNNDGWMDLVVFQRFNDGFPLDEQYNAGHVVFINEPGVGFVDASAEMGINQAFALEHGVMGCQVGDLNNDGIDDLFYGNGGPESGQVDGLMISNEDLSPIGAIPQYDDLTSFIDYPAPEGDTVDYPSYPYRTHGTAIVDVDSDGRQELAVTNGGMMQGGEFVVEPNRLFAFDFGNNFSFLKVRPVGNGSTVSRDAIGARVAVTVNNGKQSWTLHRTMLGGSAFSAQNGFDLFFGLRDATVVEQVEVKWPDGTATVVTENVEVNASIVITRNAIGDVNGDESIDLQDFKKFKSCMTGVDGDLPFLSCMIFDADFDGDNDLFDFARFQREFTGSE